MMFWALALLVFGVPLVVYISRAAKVSNQRDQRLEDIHKRLEEKRIEEIERKRRGDRSTRQKN